MSAPDFLRQQVVERADNRCEYCGLAQAGQEALFHVDHIYPSSLGGPTVFENLALACVSCSLRKAARISATDPATGEKVSLFHPRQDSWNLHFRWNGCVLNGISPSGRATVSALMMNREIAISIRHEESLRGRHPAPGQL